MRGRPKPSRTPVWLRRFDPTQWAPGLEGAGQWWAARDAWQAEDDKLPDLDHDPEYPIPDAPWEPI